MPDSSDTKMQLRCDGCLATPPLWKGSTASPFRQMELTPTRVQLEDAAMFSQHRLGKLAEAFVFEALKKNPSVTWVCDNLQIQQDKRTVGEVDALFYQDDQPVHLEVAYKFYLFDTRREYEGPLAPWIGPNRKDRLVEKLGKLHRKQFPLLHSPLARPYLDHYGLSTRAMEQRLCFLGQLFLPYLQPEPDITPLNRDCIAGTYLTYSELRAFSEAHFFIPQKPDWLITPNHGADWISYTEARKTIKVLHSKKRSPMVWVRQDEGLIEKCFVVFW